MVTNDDDNKRSKEREKRCFDLFATLLLAFGDDETRARRGKELQDRNMLMIQTITNAFLLGQKRKIDHDHDHESKNRENTASSSSSSLVEYKRRRVVESDDEEPISAEPIREIKPPLREKKGPVKLKEPVVIPRWLVKLMREKRSAEAKMIFEKVLTKTDLTPNQGRLLMPFKQMDDMDFLTEAELKILEEHRKDKGDAKKKGVNDSTKQKKGVDVILLKRNGNKKWKLNMRIWEMRTSFNYALCTGWNEVVRDNHLGVNQTITLWSFHSYDGTLYFAFDPPAVAQPQDEEAMALALVPVNSPASSSSMSTDVVISEDPFECEEINRSLCQFTRRSRTPRVCVGIITHNLEAVEETHSRSTSQESLTETTMVDLEGSSSGCNQRFMGKQLCFL